MQLSLKEFSTDLASHSDNTVRLIMDSFISLLSKPGANNTHNATNPPTVPSMIEVCYASSG